MLQCKSFGRIVRQNSTCKKSFNLFLHGNPVSITVLGYSTLKYSVFASKKQCFESKLKACGIDLHVPASRIPSVTIEEHWKNITRAKYGTISIRVAATALLSVNKKGLENSTIPAPRPTKQAIIIEDHCRVKDNFQAILGLPMNEGRNAWAAVASASPTKQKSKKSAANK